MRKIIKTFAVFILLVTALGGQIFAQSEAHQPFLDCNGGSLARTQQNVEGFFTSELNVVIGMCKRTNGAYDVVILTSDMKKELDRVSLGTSYPPPTLSVEFLDEGKFPMKALERSKTRKESLSPRLVKLGITSSTKKIIIQNADEVRHIVFLRSGAWNTIFIH